MKISTLRPLSTPSPHFLSHSNFTESGVVLLTPRRVKVARVTSEDNGNDGFITDIKIPAVDERNKFPAVDDESSPQESTQPFLDNLGLELDSGNAYIFLLYGGGSLVALWLLSAIVGAIESIPVLPQLLEVIGLGYSLWFTTRYLLFKKNREELSSKVEELKRDLLGSGDS